MSKRSRFPVWPWVLLALLVGLGGLVGVALVTNLIMGGSGVGNRIGLIEVSGEITDEGSHSLINGSTNGGRDFVNEVEAARKDSSIKAVVIRIDSPGGSPSASQEMYQAVQRLRSVKPVICSMGDVAASGGYYVASGCDKIYADASTTTGSIGVIAPGVNVYGLAHRYGVQDDTVKSARLKGGANPLAPVDPLDRLLRKSLIDNIYKQFVNDVLAGRAKATGGKLTRAKLLALADGRIFTGEQAKANLLVDSLGGLYDAVQEAAKQGGLSLENPPVRAVNGGSGTFSASTNERDLVSLGASVGEGVGQGLTRGAATQLRVEARGGSRAGILLEMP